MVARVELDARAQMKFSVYFPYHGRKMHAVVNPLDIICSCLATIFTTTSVEFQVIALSLRLAESFAVVLGLVLSSLTRIGTLLNEDVEIRNSGECNTEDSL